MTFRRLLERTLCVAALLASVAFSRQAHAQTPPPEASRFYVEAVAQSAVSHVVSQSYGAEAGVRLFRSVQLFVDVGRVRDAATAQFGSSALLIAGFLSRNQSNVTFQAKQPIAFGVGGLRYPWTAYGPVEPYVLAGAGVARVKKDLTFALSGTEVSGNLERYGVVLGSDLSGTETDAMFTLGGGVTWAAWRQMVIDFQYRYGHVFAADESISVNRAGLGLGVRF